MNSKLVLVSALAAGVLTTAGMAQTGSPQAPASHPTAPAAAPAPQAIPAKIAFIELAEAAAATNEGQKVVADVQKRYQPQKDKLDALKAEVDALTKTLQNPPATMSDEEKAARARDLDTKQKQLQRDADDAQTAYSSDVQDAIGQVIRKLGPVVVKYVQQNGYTVLLDNSGQAQQGGLNLLWGGTDISAEVVAAYNATAKVAAPMPSAPSASHPTPAAPKSPAPKQ
jgi:outer membrane protein